MRWGESGIVIEVGAVLKVVVVVTSKVACM